MQIEIIVVATFAILTIGRVGWELVKKRPQQTTPSDEAWDAIR